MDAHRKNGAYILSMCSPYNLEFKRRPVAAESTFAAILIPLDRKSATVEFIVVVVHWVNKSKPASKTVFIITGIY
jgi:hypothetical protein